MGTGQRRRTHHGKAFRSGSAAGAMLGATLLFAACSGTPSVEVEREPSSVESTIATPEASEPSTPDGTRERPFPYGAQATFVELGELGEAGWHVTVTAVADVTEAVYAQALEGWSDPEYATQNADEYASPAKGNVFLGVSGTVERLIDYPARPDTIDLKFITSDGKTVNTTSQYLDASPSLDFNDEVYAPAVVGFTEIFEVPAGTTGQALVMSGDTQERFYFGESAIDVPELSGLDALRESWNAAAPETQAEFRKQWAEAKESGFEDEYVNLLQYFFTEQGLYVTYGDVATFVYDGGLE